MQTLVERFLVLEPENAAPAAANRAGTATKLLNLSIDDTDRYHLESMQLNGCNALKPSLTHLHQTLNAPGHPIRNRLLCLPAASPDLLAIIKQEGKV